MLRPDAEEAPILPASDRVQAAIHEATVFGDIAAKTAPTLLPIGNQTRIRSSTTTGQPTRIRIRTLENKVRELLRQVSKLAPPSIRDKIMRLPKIALAVLLCSTLIAACAGAQLQVPKASPAAVELERQRQLGLVQDKKDIEFTNQ